MLYAVSDYIEFSHKQIINTLADILILLYDSRVDEAKEKTK
jgi:hypothetical protein